MLVRLATWAMVFALGSTLLLLASLGVSERTALATASAGAAFGLVVGAVTELRTRARATGTGRATIVAAVAAVGGVAGASWHLIVTPHVGLLTCALTGAVLGILLVLSNS